MTAAKRRLYVIGDSISIDYGPWLCSALADRLCYDRKGGPNATLLDPVRAEDANGGDSAMVLAYLRDCRERGAISTDMLLVNCGLHDIKRDPATNVIQVPIEAYRINLAAIIAETQSLQAMMVWVRTTPVDSAIHNTRNQSFHRFSEDVDAYNAAADEVMAEHHVPSIDLYGFTRALEKSLYRDHVHFHKWVQVAQAQFIVESLERLPCFAGHRKAL